MRPNPGHSASRWLIPKAVIRISVSINVDSANARLEITVTDDGTGLRADMANAKGCGVKNMRARAARLGGALTLADATKHAGTSLHMSVPCPDMRAS